MIKPFILATAILAIPACADSGEQSHCHWVGDFTRECTVVREASPQPILPDPPPVVHLHGHILIAIDGDVELEGGRISSANGDWVFSSGKLRSESPAAIHIAPLRGEEGHSPDPMERQRGY